MQQKSPTLEDVARVAGVSRATVSRVVNGRTTVDPAVAEVVHRAIASIGYVPNRAARSLVTRRTGIVAVVIAGADPEGDLFGDPFFGRVVDAFVRTLRRREVHPLLMLADDAAARRQVVDQLRLGGVDGALLVSTHPDDPLAAELAESGRPLVLFAQPGHPLGVSYVDLANADGGRLAAEHLLSRGCRSLGMIAGPLGVRAARDRRDGFLAAIGDRPVRIAEGNFTAESGERAMLDLLVAEPLIDGVFVGNDVMAQGALHALREVGRRVPRDVAVIGFDDSPVATLARPTLTTVRQPVEEMAEQMARLLLDQVATGDLNPVSVVLEPSLVRRESA